MLGQQRNVGPKRFVFTILFGPNTSFVSGKKEGGPEGEGGGANFSFSFQKHIYFYIFGCKALEIRFFNFSVFSKEP